MILLRLFFEFFIIGLFSVGGGLATIPFLTDLGQRTGWFTIDQLTNMIAVSESTPGPLGVNMATYVGFEVGGVPGAVVATLGLISPCIAVILIISACLKKFSDNPHVKSVFYGLRPASTGLIAAAGWSVICLSLISFSDAEFPHNIQFSYACIVLAAVIFFFTHFRFTKKVHPVAWIVLSAIAGIVLEL